MLELKAPAPGLLFASFLYRSDLFSDKELQDIWASEFGESFVFIPDLNPLAKYYAKEMGDEALLARFFVLTHETFSREYLLRAKLWAQKQELTMAQNSQRMVNIDIGLFSLENFILATTKNYSHRVYIGENIFADLTYQFQNGKFQMFPWTYPDYQDDQKLEFFIKMRQHLLLKNCSLR